MFRSRYWLASFTQSSTSTAALLALVGVNTLFNIIANSAFKVSAFSPSWRGFLIWQVAGNIAGLITVLTLTALLRFIPLHTALRSLPVWPCWRCRSRPLRSCSTSLFRGCNGWGHC